MTIVYDILRYFPSIVYCLSIFTVIVKGESLRSLFTINITRCKTSYTTAVKGYCKWLPFFDVNDWCTAVYGRAGTTWDTIPKHIRRMNSYSL